MKKKKHVSDRNTFGNLAFFESLKCFFGNGVTTTPRHNLPSFAGTLCRRLSVVAAADSELGLWSVPANAVDCAFDASAGSTKPGRAGLSAGRAGGCAGRAALGGRWGGWLPSNLRANRTDGDLHLPNCFREAKRPTCPRDIEPTFLRQPFERSYFDFVTCLGT